MAIVHLNFESKYLRMNTDVNIVLPNRRKKDDPKNFYQQGRKYPVLWLLHGGNGDYTDWIRKSNIEVYACERDLMVVMPSAYNSYYGNWPHYSGGLFMPKYLIEELMPLVYAWFPASDRKEDNFIAGLSMGGQGTIKFTAEYPEKFAAGAVLSAPAIDYRMKYMEENGKAHHPHADYVDANGGLEAFLQSSEYTRYELEQMAAANRLKEIPPLYFTTGGADPFRGETEEFLQFLSGLGLDVQLHVVGAYAHEWRFWDLAIDAALQFFAEVNPELAVR